MNTKSLLTGTVYFVAALLLAVAPACAADTLESVYAAAKKEGKVVFWSAMDSKGVNEAAARFSKRFPGIQFEQFRIQPGPALERIVTEASAGRVSVDAFDTNLSYLPQLLERNLVEPYEWQSVFGVAPELVMYDKRVMQYMTLDIPLAYNTGMVKPADIKSWEDLADPRWRGKLVVEARGVAFAILSSYWGEDKTFDYLKRLLANRPIITKGGTPTVEALAGGQGAIAIGTYAGRVIQSKEEGAPIDWMRVGPVPAMIYVVGVAKGAPHPNAARLWNYWMVSAEGQTALWDTQRYGMAVGPNLSPVGQEMKAKDMKVVLEGTDQKELSRLIEKVAGQIGALK